MHIQFGFYFFCKFYYQVPVILRLDSSARRKLESLRFSPPSVDFDYCCESCYTMDTGLKWQQKTLVNELTQGMELTKQLKIHLSPSSMSQTQEFLVHKIVASFEKALLIVKWSGPVENPQPVAPSSAPQSPLSVNGSPRTVSEDFDKGCKDHHQEHKDFSKKRKTLPTWTDQVRVCSETGLEGPHDDGYNWRKYGQKDILGAKYPRSYYRCTYRNLHDCWATKQVQRSDEDPSMFEITYRGKHTCTQGSHSVPAPASPEKQEIKQNNHNDNNHQQQHYIENPLNYSSMASTSYGCMKSETSLFPQPSAFNKDNYDNLLGCYSPTFISPATSDSNCFSLSPCQMSNFGGPPNLQHSESELTEIISAANSPILNLEFPLDQVDFDPSFPFDTPGFFS